MTDTLTLTETSDELREALKAAIPSAAVGTLHTGGGRMVMAMTFPEGGAEVWLTREENWICGFYNFADDPDDEGACVDLMLSTYRGEVDDPNAVARKVATILNRMGVI